VRAGSGILVALVLAGCSFGGGDGNGSSVDEADYVAEIVRPFFDNDETFGMVGLSAEGPDKTRIAVELDDPPQPRMRTEVRRGGCMSSIGSADYLLNDLEDGFSETVIDVALPELRQLGYTVFIRRLETQNLVGLCADVFTAEEN
jgi:hypothetical protein